MVRLRFGPEGQPTAIEPFVTGFLQSERRERVAHSGRPVGVAAANDGALLFSDDGNGVIYRVSYQGPGRAGAPLPEPRLAQPMPLDPRPRGNALALARPETQARDTLELGSGDFRSGGTIPTNFSAYGQDISPGLAWTGVPAGTRTGASGGDGRACARQGRAGRHLRAGQPHALMMGGHGTVCEARKWCAATSCRAPAFPITCFPIIRRCRAAFRTCRATRRWSSCSRAGPSAPGTGTITTNSSGFHPQLVVGLTHIVTITTDDWHTVNNIRQQIDAFWRFLLDEDRIVQRDFEIKEYTDPEHDIMIPHRIVLNSDPC